MRKFLATLLALAMALSLMVPAAWAEPADEPASATYEAVLGKTARKYGNIELDISTEKFMKAGFAYGDVVTVDVNGNSYEMPVCSNYNDVDTGKMLVRATEGASSVIVAINYGQLAVDAGLAKPNTDPAVSDKYVAADGVTYPVKVTITMKEAGAYYNEWDARQLPTRTGDRNADMYKNLTDAEFANVRVIETTGMGEGVLYRGSSPINDAVEGRNPYADAAAKAAGIKTFINLADSEAAAKAYPGWEGSYYSTQDAVFLNMPVAFTTDAFKTGLANGYRYIASSETEAPYYMHCTEGKDRCGIASAVLECFMGASYDEVVADYLVTYYNYYGIQPGTEKATNIAKYGIVSALQTMFGVEDLSKADLQAEALDYLLEIGLNAEEIVSLLLTLSGLPASLEGLVVILHSNDVHGNIMGYSQMAALRDAFESLGAVVYVTGAELLEALEASTFSTPGAVGAFPQVAGIDFTIFTDKAYDANTDKYPGSTYYGPHSIQRVVINSINGKPFDLNARYAVITNNFVAAGGDTYYAFAAASSQFDTGRPLDEVLMEYITEKLGGVVGEQYAEPQGRITIANCTEGSHDFRLVNAKDATCVDDGYTGDVVCAGCGEVQSKGEVIKATGEHHYDKGVCTVCGAKDPNYKPPTTGDSGVLLYVGLAVMAIGGSAAVVTRKKERT